MRPSRRPTSLTEFVANELGPLWCHVADRFLNDRAPVTPENAAALAELLGLSVGMVEAIDRNHRKWIADVKVEASIALASVRKFEEERLTHGRDRIWLYYDRPAFPKQFPIRVDKFK
jgi:hypothetical protein